MTPSLMSWQARICFRYGMVWVAARTSLTKPRLRPRLANCWLNLMAILVSSRE
jgi:hypothetical protein